MKDPIVEEIRKTRELHARAFNYDLEAIFDDIRQQQRKSKRQYISFPAKRLALILKEPGQSSESH